MEKNITCFIAYSKETNLNDIIKGLPECRTVKIPCADNTETYRYIAAESHTPYTLVCRTKQHVRLGSRALERMVRRNRRRTAPASGYRLSGGKCAR